MRLNSRDKISNQFLLILTSTLIGAPLVSNFSWGSSRSDSAKKQLVIWDRTFFNEAVLQYKHRDPNTDFIPPLDDTLIKNLGEALKKEKPQSPPV